MAYFTTSALVAGQAMFNDKNKSGEWRLPDSVTLALMSKAEIANPSLAALRTREDRSVYAYFPIRQAAVTGTARAHNHTGARGDSSSATLSWSTYSEPFSISLKQADNNVFSFEEMYASGLNNAVYNLLSRLDAGTVAALVAAKTQVNAGGGKGSFNATSDNYEVPLAEQNFFFQNIRQMMGHNLYRGVIDVIADDIASIYAQRLMAQGSANSMNYGFQFMNLNVVGTTRSILGTSYDGSALAFERGLVAIIPWIPKQNRVGQLSAEDVIKSNTGSYGNFTIPQFPGVQFAIHGYSAMADNSSYGGYTQDVTMYFEVSVDLAVQPAPLSSFRGANDSVVYAIGQLSA